MGKVSFKALICAVFYAIGIMALSGCIMEPINLTIFVEDDGVTEIIDKGAGTVNISNDSDADLKAGNGKISGLSEKKYYMIEDWGENPLGKTEPDNIMFVSSNGTRVASLTGIGRVTGTEITGLTNYHNYRVRSARFLTGSVSYIELGAALQGNSSRQQAVIDEEGAATFRFPDNGGYIIFTPPLPPPAPIVNYDIVKIPVTPAGAAAFVPLISGEILTEAAEETTTDYVFFDRIIDTLYVLKVLFPNKDTEPPAPEGITVNITLDFTGDNPPQTDPSITYSQSDDEPIIINVTNASQYDGIKWYIDGEEVGAGASFSLIISEIKYKIIGVYTITVEAVRGGIPYSTIIEVTVTP
jgi:hypothetical protein